MHLSRRVSTPWWLLPNLFALDAPIVAVVWQRFLASRLGVTVPLAATIALAATVWCIYLTDRLLDAKRGQLEADRHRIAAHWPRAFAGMAVLAGCFALGSATQLPSGYSQHGLVIGLGVSAYLIFVHGVACGFQSLPGAKELLVAVGFAAGVAIPLSTADQPLWNWLPVVVAFGCLCWLNCRCIDRWESLRFEASRRLWLDGLVSGLVLAACWGLPVSLSVAVASAMLGLVLVQLTCPKHLRIARVLADVVLLTPLLCWGIS
jgi:hypothetical protein